MSYKSSDFQVSLVSRKPTDGNEPTTILMGQFGTEEYAAKAARSLRISVASAFPETYSRGSYDVVLVHVISEYEDGALKSCETFALNF